MTTSIKSQFIDYLKDNELTELAEAIHRNQSDALPDALKHQLAEASSRFRMDYGLTAHAIDVGFSGPSPCSGAAGRWVEISE